MLYFFIRTYQEENMENQPVQPIQTTQPLQPTPQIQAAVIPEKPKTNYWMISTILLLLIAVGFGSYYYLNTTLKDKTSNSNQNNSQVSENKNSNPTTTPEVSTTTKPSQIRLGGLLLSFPEQWTPIFASPNDGKSVIYFATSDQEAKTLSSCATGAICKSYSLKLEDFTNSAVWQNSTIEDFIKQVKPELKLNKLTKTKIDGHDAWSGYVDSDKVTYQLVIDTSTELQKSIASVIATTSNKESGVLEAYVTKVPAIKVLGFQQTKQNELSTKIGYAIELESSLNTEDNQLINSIVDSFLAPKGSTYAYQYFLYTESVKKTDGSAGGPTYPQSNPLNYKYLLLTNNNQLKPGVYGTSQVKIILSQSQTKDLGSYLADPKYCQQDSDCQYRANFCTIGAYNAYHQFAGPWGCGPADLEGLGNSNELATNMSCQDVGMKYDELKCVSNSCKAINPKAVCK